MKKLLLSLFLVAIGYSLIATFPSPALAQTERPDIKPKSWQVQPRAEWEKIIKQCDNPGNPQLASECYSGPYSLGSLIHTLLAIVNGTTDNSSAGASGIIVNLYAATLFSQPSSLDYLADVGNNLGFNLVRPAYAQGVGYRELLPLLEIWKVFRNIAYILFVVIFLVIGFMVMFRRKLDPQTVVGIQHALPRIVVALLLVTFSYAIVGFMVDLMLLLTSIIAITLGDKFSTFAGNPTQLVAMANSSIFELLKPITGISNQLGAIVDQIVGELIEPGLLNKAVAGITSISVQLVFGVVAIFAMLKTFFMLLEAFVHIVISVIFSPLQLSLAAIPGNQTVRSWLLGLTANILIFPTTFVLIFIAAIFLGQHGEVSKHPIFQIDPEAAWPGKQELRWAPPLLGGQLGTPNIAQVQEAQGVVITYQNVIGVLIAFGILFILPKIESAIKQALQVKESPLGGAFREQLRAGAGWTPFVGGLAQRAVG